MPSVKLLFTLLSLAVFNISFNPLPTYALTLERDHMARSFNFAHAGLANKKRDGKSKRCRHRTGSEPSVSSSSQTSDTAPTSTPQPQPQAVKTTSSPAATHSPAAAAAASPSTDGNRKVGVAWSNHEETKLCEFKSPFTKYLYNWQFDGYHGIIDPAQCGFTYMPMIHEPASAPAAYQYLISRPGSGHILNANEPDIRTNEFSVADVVKAWYSYAEPLRNHGYILVSPAVTCTDFGLKWMQEFFNQCNGCHIDSIAIHCYFTDPQEVIKWIETFFKTFGLKIWLTEYACQDFSGRNNQCTLPQIENFIKVTEQYLMNNPNVHAFFYFSFFTEAELAANRVNPLNSMMTQNGDPNALAELYLNP